ncbi:RHS repeat-associated core domain-containing protein [Roseimicrobium gellanilyticum]|nr:RHS repeat-associated core domain-containing protein [Roseimicrobium gellanilyticum]
MDFHVVETAEEPMPHTQALVLFETCGGFFALSAFSWIEEVPAHCWWEDDGFGNMVEWCSGGEPAIYVGSQTVGGDYFDELPCGKACASSPDYDSPVGGGGSDFPIMPVVLQQSYSLGKGIIGSGGNEVTLGTLLFEKDLSANTFPDIGDLEYVVNPAAGSGGAVEQVKVPPSTGPVVQYKTDNLLVDITDTVGDDGIRIRFYDANVVSASKNPTTGRYTFTGDPIAEHVLTQVQSGTDMGVQISSTVEGKTTVHQGFAVLNGDGSGSRTEVNGNIKKEIMDIRTGGATPARTIHITESRLLPNSQTVVMSAHEEHYELRTWGEALIQRVVDPAGANLVTEYTYDNEGNLILEERPDGSWAVYNQFEAIQSTYTPWLDGPTDPSLADSSNSRWVTSQVQTQYDSMGILISTTRTNTESILGAMVSKAVSIETEGMDPVGSGSVILLETKRYHGSESTPRLVETSVYDKKWDAGSRRYVRGDLRRTIGADGVVRTYEKVSSTVNKVTMGTIANPEGIAGKTTQVETETGDFGAVRQTTRVYTGSSTYVDISEREISYTAPTGFPQVETIDGQTISTVTRPNATTLVTTDAEGVSTTQVADGNGELASTTRNGVTTTYGWASQNGLLKRATTRTAGTLTLTSYEVTDPAGRVVERCDENGVERLYSYTLGGRVTTEYGPGPVNERRETITTQYLDGQVKSLTGNAVVDEHYTYAVDGTSNPLLARTRVQTTYIGDGYNLTSGNESPRWRKSHTDGVGRTVCEQKPGPDSTVLTTTHHYNSAGQLVRVENTGSADLVHGYDIETGTQNLTGYDLDDSGTLELASNEPVTKASHFYELDNGDWWQVQESLTLTNAQSGTEGRLTRTRRKLGDGLAGPSETTQADGTVLTTSISINSTTRTRTVTTTSSRSDLDGVQTLMNGLLMSVTQAGHPGEWTYTYDDMERLTSFTEPGQSATITTHITGSNLPASSSGPQGSFTYSYYAPTSPWAGELESIMDGEGAVTTRVYSQRGELAATWGTGTYPVRYEYNAFGDKVKMHTYQTDPASNTPVTAGNITEWVYEASTGLLLEQKDAANEAVTYEHEVTANGSLMRRIWARGEETEFVRDKVGRLISVLYDDANTPDVQHVYLRDGSLAQSTDGAGVHDFTYDGPARQQVTEVISGTGLLSGYTVEHRVGHRTQTGYAEVRKGTEVVMNATRTHASGSGMLQGINGPAGSAWTYAYRSVSPQISEVGFTATGGTAQVAVREYDTLGRVSSIRYQRGTAGSTWSTYGVMGWNYTYHANSPQRREAVLPYRPSGGSALAASPPGWAYDYNLRGEVTGVARSDADGLAVDGQDWGYDYDAVGNRLSSTQDAKARNYTANALNQYANITHSGQVEISGLTASGVTRVAVNGQPSSGRPPGNGEPDGFSQWLTVPNTANGVWHSVQVKATRPGEPPETPLDMLKQGRIWVPQAQTSPQYDEDGNLLFDGRWRYTWDGENRLLAMETDGMVALLPNAPPRMRVEFAYDGQSRRVAKVVKRWQSGPEQWVTIASWKYLYEGWNVLVELDELRGGAVERSYVWGSDLSGNMRGAGGVGGLLGVYDGRSAKVYNVMTEVNGNVMGLVDAASGQWVARYDYDAFGNRITAVGTQAGLCPYGFSTKYTDVETGLCYYGYRYYSPDFGRWLNRDPIAEHAWFQYSEYASALGLSSSDTSALRSSSKGPEAGVNELGGLNAFVGNNPIATYDVLGLHTGLLHGYDIEIYTERRNYGMFSGIIGIFSNSAYSYHDLTLSGDINSCDDADLYVRVQNDPYSVTGMLATNGPIAYAGADITGPSRAFLNGSPSMSWMVKASPSMQGVWLWHKLTLPSSLLVIPIIEAKISVKRGRWLVGGYADVEIVEWGTGLSWSRRITIR